MQVIVDSLFARPGSAPIWGGKKGEFRDWTSVRRVQTNFGRVRAQPGLPAAEANLDVSHRICLDFK